MNKNIITRTELEHWSKHKKGEYYRDTRSGRCSITREIGTRLWMIRQSAGQWRIYFGGEYEDHPNIEEALTRTERLARDRGGWKS